MTAGDAWRQVVTPDMDLVVDASGCIVFEVTDGLEGHVLRRVTITNVGELTGALVTAQLQQHVMTDEAEQQRLDGLRDRLSERGARARLGTPLTRAMAVNTLCALGVRLGFAQGVVSRAAQHAGEYVPAGERSQYAVKYADDRFRIFEREAGR